MTPAGRPVSSLITGMLLLQRPSETRLLKRRLSGAIPEQPVRDEAPGTVEHRLPGRPRLLAENAPGFPVGVAVAPAQRGGDLPQRPVREPASTGSVCSRAPSNVTRRPR